MSSIAVIGAGITGLGGAWRLDALGHDVTVFEASDRVGGSISTYRESGYLVEEGPNTIQLSSRENEQWLHDVGLGDAMIDADERAGKRYLVRDGQPIAVPQSPGGFLGTPLFSFGAKVRLIGELFAGRADPDADESLADFVRRRLGQEMLDYAIDPFVGGVYAGNPHQLSVRYGFPKLHRLEQRHRSLILGTIAIRKERKREGTLYKTRLVSFADGLTTLPEKLARDLGDAVRLNTPVTELTREEDGRWHVAGENYDAVILALPAPALAQVSINGDKAFATFDEVEHPPVTSLSLGFVRGDVAHPLDGFGALVPSKEPFRILGTLFSSSLFAGRAPDDRVLLTTFVGGTRSPHLAQLSDEELLGVVMEDLGKLFGVKGSPQFIHRRTWPKAIPQYRVGYGRFIELTRQTEKAHPGLHVGGNALDGISLSYCIEAGRRLAGEVGEYLKSSPGA